MRLRPARRIFLARAYGLFDREAGLLWFPEEKLSVAVTMNINTDRDDYADDAADALARSLLSGGERQLVVLSG